jgi:geranylgeranyl pyrophosphate synthase
VDEIQMQVSQFSERVPDLKERVEDLILSFAGSRCDGEGKFAEAMSYAANTEGKRIRPLLVYASAELLSVREEVADYPAAAIELIHTYSLVHDDLPAMDNDDLRRGEPTVHKAFDEATAILVGDALLTHAFELLADAPIEPEVLRQWLRLIAGAAGASGMILGQSIDLEGETRALTMEELEVMHRKKTGALIEASLRVLPVMNNDDDSDLALTRFGRHMGLAFQIKDDLLDVESSTEVLGKPQGSDAAANKTTFVSLLGVEEARRRMNAEYAAALAALSNYGDEAEGLRYMAAAIVQRDY